MSFAITVEKSLDERLKEYLAILFNERKSIPSSEVANIWSYEVELMVDPSGWYALWKVSRLMCEEYGIQFPTLIFVLVKQVIPRNLSAVVSICAVQDDIHLPEEHEVALSNLYPTVHQEREDLLITQTAECLDQLRYFYNHLWMPWDDEEELSKSRLEQRIGMYNDMEMGVLNQRESEYIKVLLAKVPDLSERVNALEKCTPSEDEVEVEEEEDQQLLDLYSQLREIQQEIEILENSHVRKLYLRKKLEETFNRNLSHMVFVVWLGGVCDQLIDILNKSKTSLDPNAHIRPAALPEALREAKDGDLIMLCPGVHLIEEHGKYLMEGTIRGFPGDESCVISCGLQNNSILDWNNSVLQLENLTLRDDEVRTLCFVRRGLVKLRHCVLEGNFRKADGLLVHECAKVELDSCLLTGLRVGIIAHPRAIIVLINCEIKNCDFGIQASEKTRLSIKDCTITNCKSIGIEIQRMPADEDLPIETGSLDLLKKFDSYDISNSSVHVAVVPRYSYASYDALESSDSDSESTAYDTQNDSNDTIILS